MPAASDDATRLTQISEPKKRQLFDRLVERDGAVCRNCGVAEDLTIDHVDAEGPTILENLQILCRSCNASKGSREEKVVRWDSAVWGRGFTMIPNKVMLDAPLGHPAFRVYALLLHFSHLPDSEWPGQDGMARLAQCSERTLRDAIRELEEAKLLRTRRRGLGKTNIYILLAPRTESAGSGAAKSADQEGSKAADPSLSSKTKDGGTCVPPSEERDQTDVPKLTKVDGRNLPFDALAQVCSVPVANRARVSEMTRALKEIRAYFAAERPEVAAAGGAHFERQLEGEIVRRARLYRERWSPGTTLTPPALAKWWHDCAPDTKGERFGDIDRV